MKTIKLFIISLFTIVFTQVSFGQDKKAYNIDNSNVGLQGYSPVSYLDLGIAQAGDKDYKSTYDQVVYYFTSEAQKTKFDKNPTKYLPQYGGYCAFGISVGAKFRVDPNKFVVKEGKYYLFLYNLEVDAQQLWLAGNHNKLVKKSSQNWNNLKSTYN